MIDFRSIPTILDADELVDKLFRRASRVTVMQKDSFARLKSTEIGRVRSVQNTLDAQLERYIASFPGFERIPPFYQELLQVVANVDRMRKSLGALQWARKRAYEVAEESIQIMKRTRVDTVLMEERKKVYGRIASILKQVDKDLKFLNEARDSMRKLPHIDTEVPTVVVAGYPNVGKSSFVAAASTGTPEVAAYPFTTKGIVVGHVEAPRGRHATERFLFIDTPGLLDRELSDRNAIERQAIVALKHLADAIVFIVDPSEHCGYPLEAQERLLADVETTFPEIPVVVAENKMDVEGVRPTREDRIAMSTLTGAGVEELKTAAIETARVRRANAVSADA